MSKRTYNTLLLKDKMADALLELMQEKPYHKITIAELTDHAGVGRVSYFRHFHSKEEVLVYKYQRMWAAYAAQRGLATWQTLSVQNVRPCFEFHYEHRDLMLLLHQAGLNDVISTACYQILMDHRQNAGPRDRYASRFAACGFAGVLAEWVGSGFDLTVDQLLALYPLEACGEAPVD